MSTSRKRTRRSSSKSCTTVAAAAVLVSWTSGTVSSFLRPATTHHVFKRHDYNAWYGDGSRRANSLFVATPFTSSLLHAPTKNRGINYSSYANQDDVPLPLTLSPQDFGNKIESFSSNISRLRVKKKRLSAENEASIIIEDRVPSTTAKEIRAIDDALIGACNSFVYFLQDEATKMASILPTEGAAVAKGGSKSATLDGNAIQSMRENLAMALIQSIRASSEVGDFVLLPKIVDAAVEYASAFVRYGILHGGSFIKESSADNGDDSNRHLALLQPRIFGEAIASMSKTKASVSKIKALWNHFVHDVASNQHHILGEESTLFQHILVSPPSSFELNTMISALAGRGKIRAAIKLYRQFAMEQIEGGGPTIEADAYTASILFGMLEDSISLDTAEDEGSSLQVKRTDLNMGISDKDLSPCWQWNEAIELLDTFLPHQLNNVAYASLLKVNAKATEAYRKECKRHGGVSSAMSVLDRMKKDEICPDTVTCSIIMSTFDKGHHWKAAISLLNAMQVSSGTRKSTTQNKASAECLNSTKWALPSPNMVTYSLAISACARCNKREAVLSLFEKMLKKNSNLAVAPKTWVYNAALSACVESCRASASKYKQGMHLATAFGILEQMESNRMTDMDATPDTDSYNAILSMLGQRILMEAKKTNTDQRSRLSKHEQNSDIIYDLLDSMETQKITRDATTYSNSIAACFSQPQDVIKIFRKSLSDLRAEGDSEPKRRKADADIVLVANSALTAAASLGNMTVVSEVLSILSQAEIKMNLESVRLIIHTLGKSGDCEGILALLICLRGQEFANEILKDRYSINILGNLPSKFIPVLDEKVYSVAITSCLKHDELAIAEQILQSMKIKGLSLTQRSLNAIIGEYCRMAMESSKKEYYAARIAKRNGLDDSKYEMLEPIYITSYARTKAALATLRAIEKPSPLLLATVAKACCASGLWQDARSILRRMHRAAIQELKASTSSTAFEGKFLSVLPRLHRYLLKFCAKGGNITPALNFADDIQYLSSRVRVHRKALLENIRNEYKEANVVSLSSLLLADNPTNGITRKTHLSETMEITKILGRPLGLTGQDWKLLLIAAWRGGHWKVCVGTLPFICPYVKETHPKHSRELSIEDEGESFHRKPSIAKLNRKYGKLESGITAAILCFEARSQYAWAIRAMDDWIEWSGRRPPKQAVAAACRILAKRFRGSEVLNLVSKVLSIDDVRNAIRSEEPQEYTYEKAVYVESITALHQNGLYDEADHLYAEGAGNGHLPLGIVHNSSVSNLTLDLHGMSAAVAHSCVRVFLQNEIIRLQPLSQSSEEVNWTKDIIIITGRGRRSGHKFKPVLRPEVQRMLTEEFFPPLGTSSIPGNLGALLVQREDVVAWLNHQRQQKGERMLIVADVLRDISSGSRLERALLSSGNRLERVLKSNLKYLSHRDENK
ncbi:hypothetical protein HJC23_013152 [Cyclotella cryptica]|uniref:Smr domain-containing protein n=1 Tax=Cyclotella cryptica TaxID=29204 RepID=A0ABD3QN90_9STRA|eukprot:CCRYP_003969-RA/>CCRYP_003969-RA protein AED:0.01 eAED:0.01 QI:649/1/1/1/1/1/2/233/1424